MRAKLRRLGMTSCCLIGVLMFQKDHGLTHIHLPHTRQHTPSTRRKRSCVLLNKTTAHCECYHDNQSSILSHSTNQFLFCCGLRDVGVCVKVEGSSKGQMTEGAAGNRKQENKSC